MTESVADLVRLARRRNAKRRHLLVSTVLGKHIPADPRAVHAAGLRLGRAVAQRLDAPAGLVIGYAETATGLGHCVAEALGADCLHSTRRSVPTVPATVTFEEPHSHATGHLLSPEDPQWLIRPAPVVLVDDELSTGTTAINTIAALHRLRPRAQYVVAALVDVRTEEHRARLRAAAAELGTRIDVVALATGPISTDGPLFDEDEETALGAASAEVIRVPVRWTARDGGRHGFTVADRAAAERAAREQAAVIAPIGPRVLVLGTEELMYAPLLLALQLAERPHLHVRYSTTTRSPIVTRDRPGYPIRTRLRFDTCDGERYAYNIARGFDDIVAVVDSPADPLIAALRQVCARVHVVSLPAYRPSLPAPLRGPQFGSYQADEVAWLLTDLSDVALEAPVEEREAAVQSGRAHYAESLPIEYQPSAEYQALFARALAESAARVACAVGLVTELVLDQRGEDVVLASLARAGTPVGILMRRWALHRHGLRLAHYSLSIVRGRGIDPVALRYLSAHHDPSLVQFVDGWTGKGAIARELADAVDGRFSAELAVLADPGCCAPLFGTREDYLIASACLNSTVSGLVSRTVRNHRILAPGQFDGAKCYAGLADADVSATFLDAVTARFDEVAVAVATQWRALRDSDRAPTWAGWRAVRQICARYDISDPNLVKPGVGETTRVLLRRVPWRVLVRSDAERDVQHVLLLAAERGVEVEAVPDLPYTCVGLVRGMR